MSVSQWRSKRFVEKLRSLKKAYKAEIMLTDPPLTWHDEHKYALATDRLPDRKNRGSGCDPPEKKPDPGPT